jgi:D-glycero-alpha-D-manno-heptose 1-phosphate guanylyltransferase
MINRLSGLTAVILAGGKGTRIADFNPGVPKPVVHVAGRPFLAYILAQLKTLGVVNVIISAGFNADVLRTRMESNIPSGLNVFYFDEPVPLGTAGGASYALRAYLRAFKGLKHLESILVLNGDSILFGDWGCGLAGIPAHCAALVVRHSQDVSRFGVVSLDGDSLIGFCEKGESGEGWISSGIYRIPLDWIDEVAEQASASFEQDLFPRWLSDGRKLVVVRHKGPFLDIGTPESLAMADEFILANFNIT